MVLKMDQRCAYAAKPFVPDLISQPWIGLSSKASDRLWFRREDKNRVESQEKIAPVTESRCWNQFPNICYTVREPIVRFNLDSKRV
jgi:hypothetical protein